MKISIVVPAFNEEAYIESTLKAIEVAASRLHSSSDTDVEVIVVDNNSDDATARIAQEKGARVIREPVQGIGRARNTGASQADGDVLVFVEGVDGGGCRFPLGLKEACQEDQSHGPRSSESTCSSFNPSL